ncbi:MAG: FliM/FliN family flagellar motor switch protein [Burkholderiaceae bacterium]
MSTVSSPPPPPPRPAPQVLDSRTLGRPVHLLPRFAAQLRQSLDSLFRLQLNRRYHASYEIAELGVEMLADDLPEGRWCVGGEAPWRAACLIDRALVLSVMARRYGGSAAAAPTAAGEPRETATEERALALLARQLTAPSLRLIDADAVLPEAMPPQPRPVLNRGCVIRLTVLEASEGLRAQVCIALESAWLDRLLTLLAAPRTSAEAGALAGDDAGKHKPQLARQLPLTLQARLLEQTMTLGELLGLQPGVVIPVRLKGTDVLVEGSRLFTASVAEHQGKLCLTSFADAE